MRWHWVTSWNAGFAKMSTLFWFGFQDIGNKMAIDDGIFWEKYWISVKGLIFCKSGTSLRLKWWKLPIKPGSNRGLTAPPKPLVGIGELQCDFRQHQKWLVKQIKVIRPLDWDNLLLSSSMNTDKSYNFFLEKFESLLENYVPLKKISRNKLKFKDTLWVTSGLQKSLSIKKAIPDKVD